MMLLGLPPTIPALAALSVAESVQEPVPAQTPPATLDPWELSSSFFYSDPPGSDGHLTAILYADRGPLHLEGRYNYEDLDTGSIFAGWKFSSEGDVSLSATPMLGAVFGRTDGIAPGLEAEVGWKRLSWYTEMEYLLDMHADDDDFFYSWSTLMYGFSDAVSAGLVVERTKLVDTDFSFQRGLALELKRPHFGLSLYAYNLGTDDSYAVVSFQYAP